MVYNIFAFDPNHYDRGSYTFLGRMDSSIPFPIKEILPIQDAVGYNLAFYDDEDVIDAEAEERERIGGSIFDLDSENIFNDVPVPIYSLDDFMNTLREFVENFATDVDDDVLDDAFSGKVVEDSSVDTPVVKEEKVYPKVPFKVRKKDYGYRVELNKISSTVSMVNANPAFYDESRGDTADDFVPTRAVRKVSEDRMGELTWEAVPRLVRHLPNSPLKDVYWILRSSRFKKLDFTGINKDYAFSNLCAYIAFFDNK